MTRESTCQPPDSPRSELAVERDGPGPELMVGGGIVAVFFGLFLGWAAVFPLDAGAYAPGEIAVSGSRQAVQHREGGVVVALEVSEGDLVGRGQRLVTLAGDELRATERAVASQIFALLAQRARLTAERNGLDAVPRPAEFETLPPDDVALAGESLRIQRHQFATRRDGRMTEIRVLRQRIAQLDAQISGFEGQIAANQEQQRLIQEELAGMRRLAQQGYAPLTRLRALERTAAQLDGEANGLRSQIARSRAAIGETRLQMAGISSRMNEDVADQLRQVEVQLNELRPRLTELRLQLARSEIRAPVAGQVVGLTVFTVGGVVQPGQTLMEIVPRDASQVILARISPEDVDNLREGQTTEVRFPGLREIGTPSLRGRVTRISADSLRDEATGASFYRAEIVVLPEELTRLGRSAEGLRPGVPVEVIVLLRKRTMLGYLLEPLTNNLWRSGSEQ